MRLIALCSAALLGIALGDIGWLTDPARVLFGACVALLGGAAGYEQSRTQPSALGPLAISGDPATLGPLADRASLGPLAVVGDPPSFESLEVGDSLILEGRLRAGDGRGPPVLLFPRL